MPEEIVLSENQPPQLPRDLRLVEDREALLVETALGEDMGWAKGVKEESEWRTARIARNLGVYATNRLWQRRGFAKMEDFLLWIGSRYGFEISLMYQLTRVGVRLGPYMTSAEMERLGKSRLYLIADHTKDGLPPDPRILQDAPTMRVEELERKLRHGDGFVKVRAFWIPESDAETVRQAFGMVKGREGATSRHSQFVLLCTIALSSMLQEQAQEYSQGRE